MRRAEAIKHKVNLFRVQENLLILTDDILMISHLIRAAEIASENMIELRDELKMSLAHTLEGLGLGLVDLASGEQVSPAGSTKLSMMNDVEKNFAKVFFGKEA